MAETKECPQCHRLLPAKYPEDLCPVCKEINLFSEVKEYIRSHDVNEFQVAEKFNLPRSKVKHWIREGRIEYKDNTGDNRLKDCYCIECGKVIFSGLMCPECMRKAHIEGGTYLGDAKKGDAGQKRYINRERGR